MSNFYGNVLCSNDPCLTAGTPPWSYEHGAEYDHGADAFVLGKVMTIINGTD